ncbi:hypothetical protein ACU42Y_02310 [Proteus mirabilis]
MGSERDTSVDTWRVRTMAGEWRNEAQDSATNQASVELWVLITSNC